MPLLYVGNPTRQMQRVYYRLDFTADGSLIQDSRNLAAKWHDIPAGKQQVIGNRDLPMQAIEHIIDQLNAYGMVGVVDVQQGNLPRKHVVPYVFNIDQIVPPSILQTVFDHNRGVLMHAGKDLRQKAAIAASQIVSDAVAEATGEDLGVNPFEVEIEQEGENESDTPSIEEGYRIEPLPESAPKRRGRPPRIDAALS